jgi:hypothetical protein
MSTGTTNKNWRNFLNFRMLKHMKIAVTTVSVMIYSTIICGQSIHPADLSIDTAAKKIPFVIKSAGNQYLGSGWKTLWWGQHYRREWAVPVSFPVLILSDIDGGLTPQKEGGGHETKTLRLLSANGREYVLRTMDKSLDVLVPDEFKGTLLNDIVNDQISTAHPYGPIAVARLADAISLFHTNPKIYYVPDQTGLGEFKTVFANKLCLLEERPSGKGWEHNELFGDADNIVNTEKMLDKIFSNTENSVDQQTFLRIRLFDMLINDWDRHEDQWVWAVKKTKKEDLYIPIGRDRDQSFSKTDGITLYFLSKPWALRPLKNLTPGIKDVRGESFSARNLDQQFLNQLTKEDWKAAINFIQSNLTDSAIRTAIGAMPKEANKISGEFLIKRLGQRRDNMMDYGMRYYSILGKQVTINGSDKKETFVIDFDKKNQVSITGLRSSNDTFYHRTFNRSTTKQINVYGLQGNDTYKVEGSSKNNFTIRLLGGDGNNHYTDTREKAIGKTISVYDSLNTKDNTSGNFKFSRHWDTLYRYNRSSVKYDWYIPLVVPGYNQDDGVSIGLGLFYKKQTWGKRPFGWQQSFLADYATGTGAFGFAYKGVFKIGTGKWDLDMTAFYKGPRYTFNYYGSGNETELNGHDRSYFRVKANNFYINPGVSHSWKSNYLHFGLQYETVEILHAQNKFTSSSEAKLDSGIFSTTHFAGVNGGWNFFNAGTERYPTRGFHLNAGFSFLNNLDDSKRKLLKINGQATFYYPILRKLIFSHRTGASTIFGDYEFYQASTLGGSENLRGFWRDRFAGRTNFYQNTELRFSIADLKGYAMRGRLGVFGFVDDGRVWIEHENSSQLHVGYGGGIFFLPYNLTSLTVFYSASKEVNMVTVKAGFFF